MDDSDLPLPSKDANELADQLASAQQAKLPFPEGLRAAAAEARRPLVSHALREIAHRIEQGVPLAEAVDQMARPMPPMLRGAFAAAARSSELSEVLLDVLEHQSEGRWEQRNLFLALTYPLIVLLFSIVVFCGVQLTVVRGFGRIFMDFEMDLPTITVGMLWWANIGSWLLLSMAALVVGTILSARILVTRNRWHRVLGAIPVAGVLWRCSGHAELARLLGLLIERNLPLSEAVALAGDCCSNADAAELWRVTAADVAGGALLSTAVAQQHRIPQQIAPYISWGERGNCLPEAMAAISELLQAQCRDRASQLRLLLPPAMLLIVLMTLFATVLSMFLPLIGLISAL